MRIMTLITRPFPGPVHFSIKGSVVYNGFDVGPGLRLGIGQVSWDQHPHYDQQHIIVLVDAFELSLL